MKKLTDKDREVLGYIQDYIGSHGYAPTYEEIGGAVNLQSRSTVRNHVKKLLELGKIETDHPGSPRAIRLKGR